jgi:predicted dehydrogenase
MREDKYSVSRRDFIKTGSGAIAASMLAKPSSLNAASSTRRNSAKMRYAIVGTGIRGTDMWGRSVARDYSDYVEFVGLCDINPGRVAFAKEYIGVNCPTFTNFSEMISQTRPDTLCVTTVDATHNEFIVKGMEMGCDIVTEKPLTTDQFKCQAILDAQARTRKNITVTFNYRYSPHRTKLKQLLMEERVGRLTSVDFHWYLDIYHGADYFRRWHGKERNSGTLFVHKATHHFDLLNWWIDSEPEEVFAYGDLQYYGHNNPFRYTKCRGCPYAGQCQHYWDITEDQFLTRLYVDNEQHDGYLRDGCVWSDDIDIFDKMAAQIKYMNGVQVSYSCTTYSPYEGYRIAFNGTKGRIEAWIKERQPWSAEDYDEIRVTDNFGDTELIQIPHAGGGHGGGDTRLRDRIFKDPNAPDPYRHAAGVRDGAMSILIGIGARTSVKTDEPVKIASLTTLKPRPERP